MQITSGQQYNVGKKLTVILCSYINRHAGTPEKQQRQNSTSSNSKDESNTTLKREQRWTMVMMWNLHIIQVLYTTPFTWN